MRALRTAISRNRCLLPVALLRAGDTPDLTFVTVTALLDTGATVSGVGPRAIDMLGLRSHGKKRLGSATEEAFVEYFLFRIGLFTTEQLHQDELGPSDLPFVFDAIDGFSFAGPMDFDVILGMDVISQCDLRLTRHGQCELLFGY